MRFRTWIKRTKAGRLVWRIIIGLIGGGITVAGGVALIGPGPGILIVLAGLGILATEFAWAGEVMMHTKRIAAQATPEARAEVSDAVITNDGDEDDLLRKIENLWEGTLLPLSASKQ